MRTTTLIVLILAASLLAAEPARAQGEQAPLPCEQRLRQVQEQLRQAENRNHDLLREIERLRRQLDEARAAGPAKPAKKEPAPSEPLASPHDLFDALVINYQEKLAHLPRESKPDQAKYQLAVREWAREATRTFRGSVDWTIRVVSIEGDAGQSPRPANVAFVVLDESDKPRGDPVTVAIPGRFIRELSEGVGTRTFKLTGTAGARPIVNPQRAEKGPTDSPRFIGPYAEFDWDLAVQNITAAK